jgi:HlyD family secretion protein
VTATTEGRVVELKKTVGDQVSQGEVIAIVEPLSSELLPVIYVSSTQGKQIQQGMEAEIAPTTVKKEEYGFMKAVVGYVGDYPVTPEGAASVVANAALVRELLGQESKIELRANLVPNADTPSGYQWSSSAGPPFKIASGTRVTVSVVVASKAPYTYILPAIKSTLGVT